MRQQLGSAWVNTADEMFLWDPAVLDARSAAKLAGPSQWEWAPDGGHIAYQRADKDLYVGTLAGDQWRITTSGDFDWSPDGRQLAYLDRSGDRCVLHLVNADGSDDRALADLTMPKGPGMGGGGGGPQDLVVEFILDTRPFEPSGDNLVWWTDDGRRIAVERGMLETCKASLVGLSGDVTSCTEWRCRDEVATPPPAADPEDAPVVFLQDENDALWRYNYRSANIGDTAPAAINDDMVLDQAARSSLPNWGFHNNFWLRAATGSSQRLTESPSFKWLGAWSSDRSWLLFADLVLTEGAVTGDYVESRFFDARRAVNLWALAPERDRLLQLTTTGDVGTFAWQPSLALPRSSSSASPFALSRPASYGIFPASALSPVLDGRFDEWTGPWQPVSAVVYGAEQRSDAADLDARFRVAWDRAGLYLALQVADDAYRPGPAGADMWQGDGVEINFDRDLAADFDDVRSSADDYLISLSFGPGLKELRGYRRLPLDRKGEFTPSGAVVATSQGYDAELLIPWEVFDVPANQLVADAAYGFNLAIDDNDAAEPGPADRALVVRGPHQLR